MCPALLFSLLSFSWAPWFSPPDFPPLAPDALKAGAGPARRRQAKLRAQLSLALVSTGLLGFLWDIAHDLVKDAKVLGVFPLFRVTRETL